MIVIPINAFSEKEVRESGQLSLFKQLIESDMDGIEIRRELLTSSDKPLAQFQTDRYTVYSAPVELFQADGSFNRENVRVVVQEMKEIKADTLKLPLGCFKEDQSDVQEMDDFFREMLLPGAKWLVENDQTYHGGTIEPLVQFLQTCQKKKVKAGLTFDTGNWQYTGESAEKAFRLLGAEIQYLHLKHVKKTSQGFETVPIPLGQQAEWEAIMDRLPVDIPVALEFPLSIHDISLYQTYIEKKKAVVQ